MVYSAYKLNKQSDNIQPWHTAFPIWNQRIIPCKVLTVASLPTYRFLRRQVRWSGIPISFIRIFHSLLWSTQSRSLAQSRKKKWMFFYNSFPFSMIQRMLSIWSLIPLPLLNPACTSGSSQFTYCWSLAWRIVNVTLLACKMSTIVYACILSCFSCAWLYATLWNVDHQTHLSLGFSRQECWSGLPCPSPIDLSDPGIELSSLMSPALGGGQIPTKEKLGNICVSKAALSKILKKYIYRSCTLEVN